jgi:hypothetical protein
MALALRCSWIAEINHFSMIINEQLLKALERQFLWMRFLK